MAEFEDDLRILFDRAEPAADADIFAATVGRRLDRLRWLQVGLVVGLGLVGLLIAWLQLGLSSADVTAGAQVTVAAFDAVTAAASDAGTLWLVGLLVLFVGSLAIYPVLSET